MVKRIISLMIALVFTFTILLTGCANNENTSLHESIRTSDKEIQSMLIQYMDKYSESLKFSGTVLIGKGNDILLDRGYGMADYDNNIPNTPHTVFEIASLTKQFTATAILMLQEKNLLSVQDLLSKYIPEYPNGDKIKIHNLLSHTSGIPDYFKSFESIENVKQSYTPEELIKLFENKQLDFDTGTSYEYSNSNYILLGYIIEKVSKMKYEDYIEKNILKPLNLKETGVLSKPDTIKDKAVGYKTISKNFNIYTRSIDIDGSIPYSAGEICSTVEDLYTWENALYSGKLINKESLNEMFTPNLNNYGYGWVINKDDKGNKIIQHTGSLPGYSSIIVRNIDKKYLIIILSNKYKNDSVYNMYAELLRILDGK